MKIMHDAALYRRIQLSALADGELAGAEFAEAMAWFDADEPDAAQALGAWRTLHVVGDVLRSDEMAVCQGDVAFLGRLQAALKQEGDLTPRVDVSVEPMHHVQPAVAQSANEPVFRWQWVAGLSSLAIVLVISWNLVGDVVGTAGAQFAQNASPLADTAFLSGSGNVSSTALASNDAAGAVMLRNPQLDAMIAAHNQLGGSSALQMPSGFLRNATFGAASSSHTR